jgi:SynChlorMet cassette protein ScmC
MELFPLEYGLKLESGNSWSLYFSSELITWAKEFARILGLQESMNNYRYEYFFCTRKEMRSKSLKYSEFFIKNFGPYCNSSISLSGLEIRDHQSIGTHLCLLPGIKNDDLREPYRLMMMALFPLYRETIASGGLILHAALLYHPDISGIALLAPGGTGKSTCAKRVLPPWASYCDDLVLVVRENSSLFYAHSLPTWSNFLSSRTPAPIWPVERSVELKGLFFLQKADLDMAVPLPRPDSVQWIYDSSLQAYQRFMISMTKEELLKQKSKIFSNAYDLGRRCPSFVLKASFRGYFWEEIEKVFRKEQNENQD